MHRARAQGWGRYAALIAGLAILLQAIALPPSRAQAMELCTAHGTKTVLVAVDGVPAMPGDCDHCGHCVLTVPADVPTARIEAPVRYAQVAVVAPAFSVGREPRARGPPRPPGQGPPSL